MDPLVFTKVVSSADGQLSVEGDGRGAVEWVVRADAANYTSADIIASESLPQRGDPLYRYTLAGAYSTDSFYAEDGDPVSEDIVVVLVTAKQERENPFVWRVTVHYEGKTDPTAEIPEVSTQKSEYQDYRTVDIFGRLVANSAVDPYQNGMPVDASVRSLVITRNLPFNAWNTEYGDDYENTLNLFPFRLSNEVDENGDPIDLAPGTVRIKRITEQRMVRSKAATVAAAKFYWRVTAELVVDKRTYRPSAGAAPVPLLHRWAVADAGFNTLELGVKKPILVKMHRPTEPQLLNGAGRLLANPMNSWPTSMGGGDYGPNTCTGVPDVYTTAMNAPLTIGSPSGDGPEGVLLNDVAPNGGTLTAHLVDDVTAGMGTLTLNANGSFTYTPASDFMGVAHFSYQAREGGDVETDSAVTRAAIVVVAAPVMNVFDRYEYADWSDIGALLEDW